MCRLVRELERSPTRIAPEQPVERRYFALVRELHGELDAIRRGGVRIGDLRQGLLDFPALREGRRVWLCWRVGEPTLEYWHEADGGAEQRRRVDEDGPWQDA